MSYSEDLLIELERRLKRPLTEAEWHFSIEELECCLGLCSCMPHVEEDGK